MSEEKVSRRGYVKYVGGIVVIAVVAAAGYGIYQMSQPTPTPTPSPTPTPTPTPSPTPTPTPTKTTIKFSVSYPMGEAETLRMDYGFEGLRKSHPELEIVDVRIAKEWGTYYEWLLTAFGGGEPPEMPLIDCIWLPKFSELGFLRPLDDYLAKWPDYQNWVETFKEGMTYQGHVYGIWANTDCRPVWWWKEFFPEGIPKTYEEMIVKAKELKKKRDPLIAMCVLGGIYPFLIIYDSLVPEERLKSPGWGLFKVEDGKWTPMFQDEYGLRALEMMKEMADSGGIYFGPVGEWSATHDAFCEKKFSAFLVGNWLTSNLQAKGIKFADYPKLLEVTPFPAPKGGRTHAGNPGGWCGVIPKAAKLSENLIWEFVTYIVSLELQGTVYPKVGFLPTRKDAYPLFEESAEDPFSKEYVKMFERTYIRPEMTEWERIAKFLDDMAWEVILGKKTPKQALEDAANKISVILE